jgi:hypothetical protein
MIISDEHTVVGSCLLCGLGFTDQDDIIMHDLIDTETTGNIHIFHTNCMYDWADQNSSSDCPLCELDNRHFFSPDVWHMVRTKLSKKNRKNHNNDSCSICMEPLYNGSMIFGHDKHNFHFDCIDKWYKIHGTCPICRRNFGKSRRRRRRSKHL